MSVIRIILRNVPKQSSIDIAKAKSSPPSDGRWFFFKIVPRLPLFRAFVSLGNNPTFGAKAARGATWREQAKEKAALSDCSQIGPCSRQAGFHAQAVIGVQGEGDGQRTVAAFVFHVIGFCLQIDQAGALLMGKEPNLLGVFSQAETSVQVGNRDGLFVTDDRPDLFALSVSEI